MIIIFFYILAGIATVSALGVISCRNPMHSALSMIATMLSLAVIFLLHKAEFIAVVQIAVYAGAVMMLLIYVIFLLDVRKESAHRAKLGVRKITSVILGGALFLALCMPMATKLTGVDGTMTEAALMETGSVQFLSTVLFEQYLLPFEVASLVLLVGLIGAVSVAKKKL